MFVENLEKIPICFYCKKLKKNFFVSKNSIFQFGWLCDCGCCVNGDDVNHKVLKYGFREKVLII